MPYWTETFFESTRIAEDSHPSNQSIRGVIAHLGGDPAPGRCGWRWRGCAVVVSMWIVVRLHRKNEALLAVTVAGLTRGRGLTVLVEPPLGVVRPLLVYIGTGDHQPVGWARGRGRLPRGGRVALPLGGGQRGGGLFLFPPWWTITDVLMNIYLLVYVAVLAAAAVIAFRGTPGPALEKPAPVRAPEPV